MTAIHEIPVEKIGALTEALNCGALLLNRTGCIVHANKRVCEMAGRTADELIGRRIDTLYESPEDVAFVRQRVEEFDSVFEDEFHLVSPDGRRVHVIISSRPLGDANIAVAFYKLITLIDISRQKRLEERLTEDYQQIAKLSDTILAQAIELKHYSEQLEEKVRERTAELREANMDAIYMLAVAGEAKDYDTGAHVLRIRKYAELMATELGLPSAEVERIGYSALLHDIGKMIVPDSILKKAGPLTPEERQIIQGHTLAGERILSDKPFFAVARQIARSHHENWNGTGYPDRLEADAIPLAARIVRLVDVYDALLSPRVYKPSWSNDDARDVIHNGRGALFDPALVNAFERIATSSEFEGVRCVKAGAFG